MSHQKETTTECFLAFCEHRAKMETKLRKPYKLDYFDWIDSSIRLGWTVVDNRGTKPQ